MQQDNALYQLLEAHFGYTNFRAGQLDIIQSVLAKKNTLALLPTGGGKSLCYQVPALAMEGLCLVISPLIALMTDQVKNLRKRNITAFALHTGLQRKEVQNILEAAARSNCKFLYVSPERLESRLFQEYLPALPLNLIAVDEAHCISQWGYDFRPSYLNIINTIEQCAGVPIIAVTASATPLVQNDICEKLSVAGNTFNVFKQSFARPNLSYTVTAAPAPVTAIEKILHETAGTAIVYCNTRKQAKEIAAVLSLKKINAAAYHAGLTTEQRKSIQNDWMQNHTRVMVCTNAFGMGIDKPDVRLVIHAHTPDCLENYYQEAGRAGRDGQLANVVLLYNAPMLEQLQNLPEQKYPSLAVLREVYKCVMNYLQIPVNEAPGNSYNFDLRDFIKKFNLDTVAAINGLKALEQEGWLEFNEQVFTPSIVQFIAGKEHLYEFENDHPLLEPLIKTLLRTYEGIYDFPIGVSEKYIAYLMRSEAATIKTQLLQLHLAGIISYDPQKEMPQIVITRTRIASAELYIHQENYQKRKADYSLRVTEMMHYITNRTECRNRIISHYFGEETVKDCGVCDNCKHKLSPIFDKNIFNQIHQAVKQLASQPIATQILLFQLAQFKEAHVWKSLEILQESGRIKQLPNAMVVYHP